MAHYSQLLELLKDLENEVCCDICLMEMKEPKALRCLHVFCIGCIGRSMQRNGELQCPTCRKVTLVPKANPKLLPTAFFLNRIRGLLQEHQQLLKESSILQKCLSLQSSQKMCPSCQKCVDIEDAESCTESAECNIIDEHDCSSGNDTSLLPPQSYKAEKPGWSKAKRDGLINAFRHRKSSAPETQVREDELNGKSDKVQRSHTDLDPNNARYSSDPLKACIDNTVLQSLHHIKRHCSHAYKVELQKANFEVGDTICLDVMPFCTKCSMKFDANNNEVKCSLIGKAEAEGKNFLFDVQTEESDKVIFSCKTEQSGQFAITAEVDGNIVDIGNIEVCIERPKIIKQWKVEVYSASKERERSNTQS